jgi:cation:H+ antiporter
LGGGHGLLTFDARQVEEFWLTAAQTLMGFAMLSKLRMERWEGAALLVLFLVQFPFTAPATRMILAGFYFILAAGLLWVHRVELPKLVRSMWRSGPIALPSAFAPAAPAGKAKKV